MDSRIEELAEIILERAKGTADLIKTPSDADRYKAYRRCEWLAVEILSVIHDYRCDHQEEYLAIANNKNDLAAATKAV